MLTALGQCSLEVGQTHSAQFIEWVDVNSSFLQPDLSVLSTAINFPACTRAFAKDAQC